jgi:hypothetical protein
MQYARGPEVTTWRNRQAREISDAEAKQLSVMRMRANQIWAGLRPARRIPKANSESGTQRRTEKANAASDRLNMIAWRAAMFVV